MGPSLILQGRPHFIDGPALTMWLAALQAWAMARPATDLLSSYCDAIRVNRKTRSMAKRKKKPVSQAEQSRRLLQAAREAGVGERATNKTLERVVREIRPTQKGSTKAKGR